MEFDLDANELHPTGRFTMTVRAAKYNQKLGKLIVEWRSEAGTLADFIKVDDKRKIGKIHAALGGVGTHVNTDDWVGKSALVTVTHSDCGRYANARQYDVPPEAPLDIPDDAIPSEPEEPN